MGTRMILVGALALIGCADSTGSDADAAEEETLLRGDRGESENGRELDHGESQNSDGRDGRPSDPPPSDPAPEPEGPQSGPGDDACDASDLDGAIDCQIVANGMFVEAFCDCFTDVGYDGDRAACEGDQPGADAFEPDACVRAALLSNEAAAVSNSMCYADAVLDLAGCFTVCPADEDAFNRCFDAVGAAFDSCDSRVPEALSTALDACDGTVAPPAETPEELEGALASLRAQRSSYVDQYCGCYVGPEFSDMRTCRSTVEAQWDPALTACDQAVLAANPAAAGPFVTCITESFLIAESACLECPVPGMLEYELCADLSVDLNFCLSTASPAVQDGLLSCR